MESWGGVQELHSVVKEGLTFFPYFVLVEDMDGMGWKRDVFCFFQLN